MRKLLVLLVLLSSCGIYQSSPIDECCKTEVVYLEDVKSGTTIFSTLDFKTITLDFRSRLYRGSNLYWGHNYGYWDSRPLWLDFDFHYSYFNRPWNFWDYYMIPWSPNNNWYNGPYNNPGYNVVYNASRRNNIESLLEQDTNKRKRKVKNTIINVDSNKPVVIPIVLNNNNTIPTFNFNTRPSYNRPNKPNRPNTYNKPIIRHNNSRSIKPNTVNKNGKTNR